LTQPRSSRTATQAGILALKVADSEDKKKEILNEVKFLLSLDHPGILRSYGVYEVKQNGNHALGMLIDFKRGGALSAWIPTSGFPEDVIKGIMLEICSSLVYLHGISIIHRDIKPSNILCERAEDGAVRAVLADFGLAAHINDSEEIVRRCGTCGFVAPEMFRPDWGACVMRRMKETTGEKLLKVDMYSVGMVVFSAVVGQISFHGEDEHEMWNRNMRGEVPEDVLEMLSVDLQSLLKGLLARKPSLRTSSLEACSHPWFLVSSDTSAMRHIAPRTRPVPMSHAVTWEKFVSYKSSADSSQVQAI
jgi:serine/threonine protein kinase